MSTSLIIIAVVIALAILFWLVFGVKRKQDQEEKSEKLAVILERLTVLTEENRELRRTMDNKLSETHRAHQEQISQTIKTVRDVVAGLTKLEETNKQVINFSAQLQNLQDILKNPKQRGVLGEYFLEETLKNVLPPNSYQMQYGFKDGTIVDAVVFVKERIIPVDSKFSLENYEKILNTTDPEVREKHVKQFKNDLKFRIDETAKYVKPDEGTMDFAFMFIPSESIYYDLLTSAVGVVNSRDLIDYAFKDKHVIIVSPTSFLAYLQTVLQGLRALQIEESAKEIRSNVEKLGKHLLTFEEFMKKLGSSMGTTVSHYNSAYKELGKIDKDVVKITGGEKSIEPLVLDKPKE
ncbi:MAG: DNA recombination protein RmuC [Candidatus Moranbacteria bacterium]|nr:DNA recombination protein RmuC [Candidatus Moranbacteria bacterium]